MVQSKILQVLETFYSQGKIRDIRMLCDSLLIKKKALIAQASSKSKYHGENYCVWDNNSAEYPNRLADLPENKLLAFFHFNLKVHFEPSCDPRSSVEYLEILENTILVQI